jgi:glyoxylase-like metal-dependent hydrolase (beta-lactamase superfamily II)
MAAESGAAVVIDPGGMPDDIWRVIEENKLQVQGIINTHGHIDHVGANAELRRRTGAPVHIHPVDAPMLSSALLCGAKWAGLEYEEHEADHHVTVTPGYRVGDFVFDIYHTPGHCPGSICLVMPEEELVYTGDLVFMDSIGRSDLPGGDEKVLMESLRWFLTLPDDYRVLPGHGAATTVERERGQNPFLRRLKSK